MAKILIIDDSLLARRMLKEILTVEGHEFIEEKDGMSGIERYFLERPDLVLLDLTMEGMHGLEVLKKIREVDPKAKVVVATADIQSSTHQMAIEAGASGLIEKPFKESEVLEKVKEALVKCEGGKNGTY